MENNDSNMKPQQTGGLKLMTVFVVVLALHVVVIGGMTTYYLFKGGSDSDLAADKTHKGLKANPDGTLAVDGQMPDSTDKSSTASTPAPDASTSTASTTPSSTPAPTTDSTTTPDASSTPSTPVVETPAPTVVPSTPATPTPTPASAVVTTTTLNPGSDTVAPVQTGPVITPPTTLAPPPDVDSAPVAGTPYIVKAHDSFAKIAHKNHVSVANLMTANNLTSNKLSIGQKLVIPAPAQTAATTPVTAPATAPAIAAPATTATVTTTDVATTATPTSPADPASAPVKEKKTKAKSVASAKTSTNLTKGTLDHHLYTVVKGDTLTKIAHRFKTTPTALMTANNITDPTKLSIGKKLVIPSREAHTAKVSTPGTVQPAQVEPKAKAAPTQVANVTL